MMAALAIAAFLIGAGASAVFHTVAPAFRSERVVYCPIDTPSPECVRARKLYEAGQIGTPSGKP